MTKRVFVENLDSGEPGGYCGVHGSEEALKAFGYYVQAEMAAAIDEGISEIDLRFYVKEMSDEQVAALPDL